MALKPSACDYDNSLHNSLAVPSYGAMALKRNAHPQKHTNHALAVPSYGAMALKPLVSNVLYLPLTLAVPSYGAMALKHHTLLPTALSRLTLQSPPTGRWP